MRSFVTLAATLVVTLSAGWASAQSAPVKMGLWEKKIVTTISGAPPTTMTNRSCVTAETWQRMVSNTMKQRPGCTSNSTPTAHGYSFTAACTMAHGTTVNVNGSSEVQDSTHVVSQSHSVTTVSGKTREIDSHSTSTFVSSSCGDVKPGDPEGGEK